MAANSGFPLSLDVRGYPVLVLGGDEEAAEKTPGAYPDLTPQLSGKYAK